MKQSNKTAYLVILLAVIVGVPQRRCPVAHPVGKRPGGISIEPVRLRCRPVDHWHRCDGCRALHHWHPRRRTYGRAWRFLPASMKPCARLQARVLSSDIMTTYRLLTSGQGQGQNTFPSGQLLPAASAPNSSSRSRSRCARAGRVVRKERPGPRKQGRNSASVHLTGPGPCAQCTMLLAAKHPPSACMRRVAWAHGMR